MWRLRRVYRIEAGILTHEALTIELHRAKIEAESYKEYKIEYENPSEISVETRITDEEQYNQARERIELTARLLQEESLALGVAFKQDMENAGAISKLSRYEATIERSYYRALHEMQRVQAARRDGVPPPSIAVDVTVDGPGPVPDGDD